MLNKAMILSSTLFVSCYLAPVFAQVAEQGPNMPAPTEERVQQILTDLREDSLMRFQPEYAPEYIAASLATHITDEDRIFGVEVNGVAKPIRVNMWPGITSSKTILETLRYWLAGAPCVVLVLPILTILKMRRVHRDISKWWVVPVTMCNLVFENLAIPCSRLWENFFRAL